MNADYSKMTQQEFDDILERMACRKGVRWLLTLPGVWEAVAEELNNDILEQWEQSRNVDEE